MLKLAEGFICRVFKAATRIALYTMQIIGQGGRPA